MSMQIPVHVTIINELSKRYEKRMAPPAAGPFLYLQVGLNLPKYYLLLSAIFSPGRW